MAELYENLAQELIDLARKYEDESEKQYLAVVERVSQVRAMVKGDSAPGDWFDDSQWRWRPAVDSPIYDNDNKPRYNYKINYMQAWWQILQGAIQTVGIPGSTFRPQNSEQSQDREGAQVAREIINYERTVIDFRDLMLGIYRFFSTDGICLAYTRYVKDEVRFGTEIVKRDVRESRVTQDAGYECPMCKGFTQSGMTMRDEIGGIHCPQCGEPLHEENFMPQQVEDVVIGQEEKEVPAGREIVDLYGALESFGPWWAKDLNHAPYWKIVTEVPREEVIAAFDKKETEIMGQTSGDDGKPARQARQYARSPIGGGLSKETGFITYSRWWFRPQCFYRVENIGRRNALLKKFPTGVFFQLAGSDSPVFLDAIEEKMESKLTLMRPLKGDGMYTPALLQSGVPIQLSAEDAWNMALEGMLFAAFGQGYADEDLFQGQATNATRMQPGIIKTLHVGSKNLKDGFLEMKSQDVSQSVQNFLAMAQPMGEFLLGTERVLQGGPITNVRTASGQSQARSQALQRQAPAYGAVKIGLADIQEKIVNEFLQNRPPETYYEVVTDSKDFEQKKIQLNPKRGRVVAYPEVSESIPQTWAQQHDVGVMLIDSQNPTVQAWLAYPKNARLFFDLIGIPAMSVPGKELAEKYERLIEILLQGEPQQQEVPNEVNPGGGPVPITIPGIPFDPVADDADIFLVVFREWAATAKGMEISVEGGPGYQNLRAYAEQAWTARKMMMQAAAQPQPAEVAA